MSNVSPARGFRDLLPPEKEKKETLLSTVRSVYRAYGFSEIETPVVEPLSRLRNSDGGDNVGMIFEILRRGLNPKDIDGFADIADLGLRYDLTVPLARFMATNASQLPNVVRTIQIGSVWRAERPQKGRFRQFTQCDIDILGDESFRAEVDLIVATLAALSAIDLDGATVRLNDRRFLDALLAQSAITPDLRPKALVAVDKLDKVQIDGVRQELLTFLPSSITSELVQSLEFFREHENLTISEFQCRFPDTSSEVVSNLQTVFETVSQECGDKSIRFDPTLVRGLGYYTGPIFEVEHPTTTHSIAGGGRYDGMIGKYLGKNVPACGFSLGFDRILEITSAGKNPRNAVALLYDVTIPYSLVMRRQAELIRQGFEVRPVRIIQNKKRQFDELAEAGIKLFQRMSDNNSKLLPVTK